METIRCSTCKESKPVAEFNRNKARPSGYAAQCKICTTEYMKTYYPANKDRMNAQSRTSWMRRENGLTQEQYDAMLIEQEFGCAICGAPEPGGSGRFHVDHDHKTGQTRGLLCWNCNRGLGSFQDSQDILVLAALYLSRYAEVPQEKIS